MSDDWDDWGDEGSPEHWQSNDAPIDVLCEKILKSLIAFQTDLADLAVYEKINAYLAEQSFEDFLSYYKSNLKIALYTIESELKVGTFSCCATNVSDQAIYSA